MDIEYQKASTASGAVRSSNTAEAKKEGVTKTSLRKLHLVIEFSQIMLERDYPPNTIHNVLSKCIGFVEEFFELNPMSNIAVSLLKDRKCHLLINFTNNPKDITCEFERLMKKNSVGDDKFAEDFNKDADASGSQDIPSGVISVANALAATVELMRDQPLYFAKEALLLLGSANTRDPHNLFEYVESTSSAKVVVNVLSTSGATYAFQQICHKTKGRFDVALNEHDFKLKLMRYTSPVERLSDKVINTMFVVSFPRLVFHEGPVVCSNTNKFIKLAYECMRCNAFNSDMPCLCGVCRTPLISSMQIARSKQEKMDKFLVKPLGQLVITKTGVEAQAKKTCSGCDFPIEPKQSVPDNFYSECQECSSFFCSDCHLLSLDSLRFCPVCED